MLNVSRSHSMRPVQLSAAFLLGLLVWVLVMRWPTLLVLQLDWDEGTRMSIASALNHGRTLYLDAWDHHTFLDILFFQGLFRVLPVEWVPVVVRVINAGMVWVICLLVWAGLNRATGSRAWAAGAASACACLFSHSWALPAHGEFYHSLPITLAFYAGFAAKPARFPPSNQAGRNSSGSDRSQLWAGALLGLGFFTKQTAAYDAVAFMLVMRLAGNLRMGWLLGGMALSAVPWVIYFALHGTWREAVYMTFADPFYYATAGTLAGTASKFGAALTSFLAAATEEDVFLSLGIGLSAVALMLNAGRERELDSRQRLALGALIWLLVDAMGLVCIGRFYAHYLIQLIVPASILATYLLSLCPSKVDESRRAFARFCRAAALGVAVLWWLVRPLANFEEGRRFALLAGERDALIRVAALVKSQTQPDDGVFLYQNRALCLYYLSERFPPTKVFMDHQLLPENRDAIWLLPEALRALEARPPQLILRGDLDRTVPQIEDFIQKRYEVDTNLESHVVLRIKS